MEPLSCHLLNVTTDIVLFVPTLGEQAQVRGHKAAEGFFQGLQLFMQHLGTRIGSDANHRVDEPILILYSDRFGFVKRGQTLNQIALTVGKGSNRPTTVVYLFAQVGSQTDVCFVVKSQWTLCDPQFPGFALSLP